MNIIASSMYKIFRMPVCIYIREHIFCVKFIPGVPQTSMAGVLFPCSRFFLGTVSTVIFKCQ